MMILTYTITHHLMIQSNLILNQSYLLSLSFSLPWIAWQEWMNDWLSDDQLLRILWWPLFFLFLFDQTSSSLVLFLIQYSTTLLNFFDSFFLFFLFSAFFFVFCFNIIVFRLIDHFLHLFLIFCVQGLLLLHESFLFCQRSVHLKQLSVSNRWYNIIKKNKRSVMIFIYEHDIFDGSLYDWFIFTYCIHKIEWL